MPGRPRHRICLDCGKLKPRNDKHARCSACRHRRRGPDSDRRDETARSHFPEDAREELLRRVAAGEHLSDVCGELGITTVRAHAFATRDKQWGRRLDAALTAGRDPDLNHGTAMAYRWGRCRCPECRGWRAGHV